MAAGQPKENKTEKKEKLSKFQTFFMLGVIPTLFAVAVFLTILSFSGINVFEKAKELGQKLPFIGKNIGEEVSDGEDQEQLIIELKGQIKDQEVVIGRLEKRLTEKDEENQRLIQQIEQLEEMIRDSDYEQDQEQTAFQEIVKTYENMTPKRAAPIISSMNDNEAVRILSNLKPEQRAAIMEKMDPEQAAKYTEMLVQE